jgi:hypothetical protein
LCPHVIGTNKNGEEVVLAWQFGGESSGKLPQWRCLKLANVHHARAGKSSWHEGGSHRTMQTWHRRKMFLLCSEYCATGIIRD